MALSADAAVQRMPEGLVEYPLAATTVLYQGSIVGLSSGLARPLVAGDVCAGIAYEGADSNASANAKARVQIRGIFRLTGSGFSQATVGALIYASDDGTITATSGSNTKIGRCVKYESATVVWVRLDLD